MSARRAQTILEYTIIVGIVTVVLYYMGTSVKRGVQSLVKLTADQVGNQQNADQDFNEMQQGYLQASNTYTQETREKQVGDTNYVTNIIYGESSFTAANVITNGGFAQTTP